MGEARRENGRTWDYELWVHLSDHVKQKYEPYEPDDCEHCKSAEVDCDDCRALLNEWELHLGKENGESTRGSQPTHQTMRAALEWIAGRNHSTCAGLVYCPTCVAIEALKPPAGPASAGGVLSNAEGD